MKTRNLSSIVLITLILTTSASAYKKVKCFVLKPPEKILPGVQRIAVLDFESEGTFEGKEESTKSTEELVIKIITELTTEKSTSVEQGMNHGRNFADYLISELLKSDRGIHEIKTGFLGMGSGREGKSLQQGTFTNVFDIVERNQLMQILEEQKLSASGIINDNQVIELGGMLGVQVIVTGNIGYTHKDSEYKQKRTRKKGDKTESYEVDCEKRQVKVTVRSRIISTETGQILASKEVSQTLMQSTCSDQSGSLPSVDDMIDKGLKKLSTDIANAIAPHYELESYELDKIKISSYKISAEEAAELAEELKVDDSYVIYKLIYDKDPYNPEVLYNLSILHEVVGNFKKAKEFANMAMQLKEEGKYQKALKRLEKSAEFAAALAQMGIEIKEHTFEVTKAAKQKVLARKVKIKGKREDRTKVFAEPDPNSQVVARVPGELTFTVLRRQGDWLLIKLLGDKKGFVHKDQVEVQ